MYRRFILTFLLLLTTSTFAGHTNTIYKGQSLPKSDMPWWDLEDEDGNYLVVTIHNSTDQVLLLSLKNKKHGYLVSFFDGNTVYPGNEEKIVFSASWGYGPDATLQVVNCKTGKEKLSINVQQNISVMSGGALHTQVLEHMGYVAHVTQKEGIWLDESPGKITIDISHE